MILVCVLVVVAYLFRSVVTDCGKPAIQPDVGPGHLPFNFIVNGTEAVPHSWPWQVKVIGGYYGGCGGSIVTPYHILTAAHCFESNKDPKDLKVLIGAHNVAILPVDYTLANVASVEIHPNYAYINQFESDSSLRNYYDIAIVALVEPIEFGDNVLDVCLTSTGFNSGTRCFVTGWGEFENEEPDSIVLRQAEVFLLPSRMCHVLISWFDEAIMTCAFNKRMRSGACVGDEGAPLVCQNDKGVWYLQGISSGIGCGTTPDIYARVPHFYKWIESKIRMRN